MSLARSKEILSDLIGFSSISSQSNLDIIEYLAKILRALGADVDVHKDESEKKANLYGRIGPDIPGGILLSGHSDVVPVEDQEWSNDPFEMIERDGKLFGRGSCDMKGFIACAMAAAESYAGMDLKRPVHFAFTYDEEVGCLGAQALANFLRDRENLPSVAIIGEPTMMRCIEGHKGVCEFETEFDGLEGHSSLPDLGVNAVEFAVRYVSKLMEIREALKPLAPSGSRFDPPWSTLSVGLVEGGVAPNVIASKAKVEWECRPVQDSDYQFIKNEISGFVEKELLPQMRAVYDGADVRVRTIGEVVGLEPIEENEAKEIVMALTGDNRADVVSFGTEAGIFQSLGMSAVVCGPGSIEQAHKADEFVSIEQIQACLDMLQALGEKVLS